MYECNMSAWHVATRGAGMSSSSRVIVVPAHRLSIFPPSGTSCIWGVTVTVPSQRLVLRGQVSLVVVMWIGIAVELCGTIGSESSVNEEMLV